MDLVEKKTGSLGVDEPKNKLESWIKI